MSNMQKIDKKLKEILKDHFNTAPDKIRPINVLNIKYTTIIEDRNNIQTHCIQYTIYTIQTHCK